MTQNEERNQRLQDKSTAPLIVQNLPLGSQENWPRGPNENELGVFNSTNFSSAADSERGDVKMSDLNGIGGDGMAQFEGYNEIDSEEDGWGPEHPCYPHRNPHVPVTSQIYQITRIIRIPRDYMINGDLSPAYSNIYPAILDPYISEAQFRTVISRVNGDLKDSFDPWGTRNVIDGFLGCLTGWVLEDLKLASASTVGSRNSVDELEKWLEGTMNKELEKNSCKIWPLRRTGFMSLDIQIPNPLPDSDGQEDHGEDLNVTGFNLEANASARDYLDTSRAETAPH